jgi:hypothetical protein
MSDGVIRFWLVVLGEVNGLRWVMANSRMAFTAARRSLASQIEAGDRIALYMGRGAYHNPTRDRSQVIGLAAARSRVRNLRTPIRIAGRVFVCVCDLHIDLVLPERHGAPVEPLISNLSFVKRPDVWGQYFRSSLVPIGKPDFDLLGRAVMRARRARIEAQSDAR